MLFFKTFTWQIKRKKFWKPQKKSQIELLLKYSEKLEPQFRKHRVYVHELGLTSIFYLKPKLSLQQRGMNSQRPIFFGVV